MPMWLTTASLPTRRAGWWKLAAGRTRAGTCIRRLIPTRHGWVRCWLHRAAICGGEAGAAIGIRGEQLRLLREQASRPVLEQLHEYLLRIRDELLPKSEAGQAVAYVLKNWTALTRYLEDGDLSIDNNHTERSLRGIAVGRNNWVFLGSDRGGQTMAVLRSFVASCELVKVDPFEWFRDVLSRIPTQSIRQLDSLLPHAWAAARA